MVGQLTTDWISNRSEQDHDGTPNSEMRTADAASDYDATVKAFSGCDALIHLAAIPNPVDKSDSLVHNNNVNVSVLDVPVTHGT